VCQAQQHAAVGLQDTLVTAAAGVVETLHLAHSGADQQDRTRLSARPELGCQRHPVENGPALMFRSAARLVNGS